MASNWRAQAWHAETRADGVQHGDDRLLLCGAGGVGGRPSGGGDISCGRHHAKSGVRGLTPGVAPSA